MARGIMPGILPKLAGAKSYSRGRTVKSVRPRDRTPLKARVTSWWEYGGPKFDQQVEEEYYEKPFELER